ncbi:Imm6 family immunity protein [Streptococcus oricebi]|uniref:Immunity protein Imm6 n=1 Tax=Streptococcus oricebi TaxID=1547447 RepID=A0ABS5B4T0_9STRE|nr:Imm6 family immunity protein [Streptococcus oricebi]MBP2623836.1 hypothetical protein [Streptococcus oricebi]
MMTPKQKAYLMLIYSEAIFKTMTTTYREQIRIALDKSWQWLESQSVSADELYSDLDDGTELHGLYIYMQMDSNEDNVLKWDNLSYALSYVVKLAYDKEGADYLPEPIENVSDEIFDLFVENLQALNPNYNTCLHQVDNFVQKQEVITKEEAIKELSVFGL